MHPLETRVLTLPAGVITERSWQTAVIEYARLCGWLVHAERPARSAKGWATPIQGDAGFPDLVLARKDRVIFAELKTDTGRIRPEQEAWLRVLPVGSLVVVWRPKDIETVQEMLR